MGLRSRKNERRTLIRFLTELDEKITLTFVA